MCQDSIEGSVQPFEFEAKPHYEAISYKWGDRRGQSVRYNDKILPINGNLYFALQRCFRFSQKTRYLWVDDIYIN